METATKGRPPKDGLDRFLGDPKTVPGDRMPLKVVARTRDFVANCDADDYSRQELLLLGASWLPVPTITPAVAARSGTIFFRTADAFIAGNLVSFMDLPTAKKLALATKAGMKHLRNSRSQKVPRTSTWPCLRASTTWASRKAVLPRSRKSAIRPSSPT